MAKLNVVIPAVEVTVGDVTYRKVDRKAQAGDIVKALRSDVDIDMGAFYAVYADSDGHLTFTDNDGDERPYQLRENSEMYEVFAPISEPAAQPSTEKITFEGATWRKVDRDVREGDAIKFTDEDRSSYLTDADLYVVNEVDFNSDPQITDDDGDEYDAGGEDYEVYEKVAEEKTVEYREVKRKASVGERIKIVAAEQSGGLYEDGEEYVVTDEDRWNNGRAVSVGGVNNAIYHREYVILEPVTTKKAEPMIPERLAVGDYARVVGPNDNSNDYKIGEIVEIVNEWEAWGRNHVTEARRLDGSTGNYLRDYQVVRATDEEVAAAKDPRSQFAAGDKVRLVGGGSRHPLNGFSDGEVYTVSNPKDTHHNGDRVEIKLSSGTTGYAYPNQLVKLTVAEAADIERKQAEEDAKRAEEAKWAAIGRKVNEYKRGDLIEIVRYQNGDVAGTITEVVKDIGTERGTLSYKSKKDPSGTRLGDFDAIKLIVPVEQRFDRIADDVAEEVDAA